MKKMPTLWYENADGDRITQIFGANNELIPPPDGYHYQISRFPLQLQETVLRLVKDGNGTRSEQVMTGTSSWPSELVLAMVRPTFWERVRQVLRYGWPARTYSTEQAILRAAGCEHCINTLAHRHGIGDWGYRAFGPEDKSRTICEGCRTDGRNLTLVPVPDVRKVKPR